MNYLRLSALSLALLISHPVLDANALDGKVEERHPVTAETATDGPNYATFAVRNWFATIATDPEKTYMETCTGTFIGDHTLLTARHCLVGISKFSPLNSIFLRPYKDGTNKAWYRLYRGKYLIMPEDSYDYDVAIVIFGKAANKKYAGAKDTYYSSAPSIAKLQETEPANGWEINLVGYGLPFRDYPFDPLKWPIVNDDSSAGKRSVDHLMNQAMLRWGKNKIFAVSGDVYKNNAGNKVMVPPNSVEFVSIPQDNDTAFLREGDSGGGAFDGNWQGVIGVNGSRLDSNTNRIAKAYSRVTTIYNKSFARMLLVAKELDASIKVPASFQPRAGDFDPKPYLKKSTIIELPKPSFSWQRWNAMKDSYAAYTNDGGSMCPAKSISIATWEEMEFMCSMAPLEPCDGEFHVVATEIGMAAPGEYYLPIEDIPNDFQQECDVYARLGLTQAECQSGSGEGTIDADMPLMLHPPGDCPYPGGDFPYPVETPVAEGDEVIIKAGEDDTVYTENGDTGSTTFPTMTPAPVSPAPTTEVISGADGGEVDDTGSSETGVSAEDLTGTFSPPLLAGDN